MIKYDLEGICQDCMYLEKIKPLFEEKEKEIDRLNNIIEELEKYIKENSIYYNTSDGCQWVDQFKVLDKLKELKEDNNGNNQST